MTCSVKLISKSGDMLPLVARMKEAGHKVLVYVEEAKDIYEGIIDKVKDINELDIQEDDLVLFDMVGAGKGADILRNRGHRVIGASALTDKIELDRSFGLEFMMEHSCDIPPTVGVDTLDEAKEVIEKTGSRYVIKPDGNQTTDLTYVSNSAEELLRMIEYFKDKVDNETPVVLQEFVEGIEMSTEAWFNGKRFLLPINSTFEEKKLMNENKGPNTGCSGNVVWFWSDEVSEILYEMLFKKMEPELAEAGYVGPIDINAIWTEDGPKGLEYTARFGYDAIQCLSRLIQMELGEFLYMLPELTEIPAEQNTYAMSVRVSIPPYPNEGDVPQMPLGVDKAPKDNVYLSDVMIRDGVLHSAGSDGYVACVAAHGKRHVKVISEVYDIVEKLEIPDAQYRTDIGDRLAVDKAAVEAIIMRSSA